MITLLLLLAVILTLFGAAGVYRHPSVLITFAVVFLSLGAVFYTIGRFVAHR